MSTKPAFVSRVLDWLQDLGEHPVVNPTKHPWSPTPTKIPGWGYFLLGLAGMVLLAYFWTTFTGGRPGFIYTGF